MKIHKTESKRLTIKHLHWELTQVQLKQEIIMAAIDNLQSAINNLNTTVTAVQTAIESLKLQPNNDATIQDAADKITQATATLNAAIQ